MADRLRLRHPPAAPGASRDDVGQRKEFLASTAAFRDALRAVARVRLDPLERALLSQTEASFAKCLAGVGGAG